MSGFSCVEFAGTQVTINSLIGPTGPKGQAGTAFFRIFAEGYNPQPPEVVFNGGVIASFLNLAVSGTYVSLVAGYSEDLVALTSYVQQGRPGQLLISVASLEGLDNLINLDLSGNALTSASVNRTLAGLVFNGLSNGNLNLSGQLPPAPPTGQGLLDLAILRARGWTIAVDNSANMTTDQVNATLAFYAVNSFLFGGLTLNLAGNTPPAPPSGQGIIDLCVIRLMGNSTVTVNVDPLTGLTPTEVDNILAALVAGTVPVFGQATFNYASSIDVTQSPPVALDNTGVILATQLRATGNNGFGGPGGWIVTALQPALSSSDIAEILSGLVAGYDPRQAYPPTLDLRGAPPTAQAIVDAAVLESHYWTILLDPPVGITSADIDTITNALVAANFWCTLTIDLRSTPPAAPSVQAIINIALLARYGITVLTDPHETLTSADVETIFGAVLATNLGGYGTTTIDVTGTTLSNTAIAQMFALRARGYIILTDPLPTLTSDDVDTILDAMVHIYAYAYTTRTPVDLSGVVPSVQAIADSCVLVASSFDVTLGTRPNLSSSDVDDILVRIVAVYPHDYGFADLSGNTPPAPPTSVGAAKAAYLQSDFYWTIILD